MCGLQPPRFARAGRADFFALSARGKGPRLGASQGRAGDRGKGDAPWRIPGPGACNGKRNLSRAFSLDRCEEDAKEMQNYPGGLQQSSSLHGKTSLSWRARGWAGCNVEQALLGGRVFTGKAAVLAAAGRAGVTCPRVMHRSLRPAPCLQR
jgi:hypothetical protein